MATFKKIGKKGYEKWSVVFDLPGHAMRKQKRLSGFNTKAEANLAHISFISTYKIEDKATKDSIKIKDVYNHLLDYKKTQLKGSSIVDIITCYEKFISPLCDYDIDVITAKDILDWQMFLNKKDLTTKYKNKVFGYLKQIFNHATTFFDLKNNPCLKVNRFRTTEKKKEMEIWTPEQFSTFITKINNNIYRAFFNLLYYSGCRVGEALALKWNCLLKDEIYISETITRKLTSEERKNGDTWKITSTKNTSSERKVMLPEKIILELTELKKKAMAYKDYLESDFIFGGKLPLSDSSIGRHKKEACALAGLKPIRNHDFRHSHVSLLISMGFDIVSIAKRLGHSNIKETLNTYSYMMPNKQSEMINALNKIT